MMPRQFERALRKLVQDFVDDPKRQNGVDHKKAHRAHDVLCGAALNVRRLLHNQQNPTMYVVRSNPERTDNGGPDFVVRR